MRSLALVALVAAAGDVAAFTPTPTPVSPAGRQAAIDLPASLHLHNSGGLGPLGPGTGAGLCVGTSVEVAARWHGLREIDGFQEWLKYRRGGSYPEKLARDLDAYARSKGIALPRYIQHTGGDPAFLDLCYRTRRMPAVTWTPSHMVSGSHLDASSAAVIDNNRPGSWLWESRAEFLGNWNASGKGWAFVWLAPPPPPGLDRLSPSVPATPPLIPRPGPQSPCPGPYCPSHPRWVTVTLFDGEQLQKLFDGDKLIGVMKTDGWHPAITADGWSIEPEGEPPLPPPGSAEEPPIDSSKIGDGWRYWLDGVEVDRADAIAALGDGLVDDSTKWHLTIVLDGKPLLTDVTALRAAIESLPGAERVHVQVYGPADWPVASGRVRAGVTLQRAAGGVVYHAAAIDESTIAEAIRFADPNHTPLAPAPTPKTPPATPEPAPCPCPSCPCTPPAVEPEPSPTPTAPGDDLIAWLGTIITMILARWRR